MSRSDGGTGVAVGLRRLPDRVVASDPGLLRLRMAGTTVLTLGMSLGVLYVVTRLAGQPFTIALLGVVISMIASMAFKDRQPGRRLLTAALMLVIAAATVTLGALLAPYVLAGDVVFVAIMAVATAARRFGPRAVILGMVGFMTYFFALFLGATVSMVPWLIIALAIGTTVSLGMSLVLRVDPGRSLRRALHALQSRLGLTLDVVGDGLSSDQFTERDRRRLDRRVTQVNETTLMVDAQLDDLDSDLVDTDEMTLRLFDLELATEHLAGCWIRAARSGTTLDASARGELVGAIRTLRSGLRHDAPAGDLGDAAILAERVRAEITTAARYRTMALAVANVSRAAEGTRVPADRTGGSPPSQPDMAREPGTEPAVDQGAGAVSDQSTGSWIQRRSPSTRQAVQVTIASSLAIVAGELLSSARWYWAVIAAFVIYSGTNSRGETLTKGWQRIVGTVAGVAVGTVVASLVGGNVAVSITLIFLSLFAGFYLMQISYVFMVIGTTTMLALLYGLLGEFTIGLLVTRIEETAIGAAIGILTAVLMLPTSTRRAINDDIRYFITGLAELVGLVGEGMTGTSESDLTGRARDLDGRLATVRSSAKPLTSGIAGLRGRGSVRRGMAVLASCDHDARGLCRVAGHPRDRIVQGALRCAISQVQTNLDVLADILDHGHVDAVHPADNLLDAAQDAIDARTGPADERQQLTLALRYLRRIDLAVVGLCRDIGRDPGMPARSLGDVVEHRGDLDRGCAGGRTERRWIHQAVTRSRRSRCPDGATPITGDPHYAWVVARHDAGGGTFMTAQDNASLSKLSDTGEIVANSDDDVRGRQVKDKDGNDVGKVEDLLVDDQDRKVRFLLVEHGGFLGIGETKSFIPIDAITRITDEDVYINHSRDHLTGAPRYDPDLIDDRSYHNSIYGYYGYMPFWGADYVYPGYPYYR